MDQYSDSDIPVPEDIGRLVTIEGIATALDIGRIVKTLEDDSVVLCRNVGPAEADEIVSGVAAKLNLQTALQLQAAFAASGGHRERAGRHFMTVNRRRDYQFIPPHSEGGSFTNLQLAAFFCFENSTDGGETVLMNVGGSSSAWKRLRERSVRAKVAGGLTRGQIAQARGLYRLNLPDDMLKDEDEILKEREVKIPGLRIFDVLTSPRRTFSSIVSRDLYAYWDSISSIDFDSGEAFRSLLARRRLLREPSGGMQLSELDNSHFRHVLHSGVKFSEIFRCSITHKLASGDLIIQNNSTWTHAVANWSPGSGTRRVIAAFA